MAVANKLAREGKLYVRTAGTVEITDANTKTETGVTWTRVEHAKNIQPQRGRTTADATSYDDAGNDAHVVTSRGFQLSTTYNLRGDSADGSRPLGQATLESLAEEIGEGALEFFKYVPFENADVYVFEGSVELGTVGGGAVNALAEVSATITASGVVYKGAE